MAETAGYCAELVAGFRTLGIRADFLNLSHHRMGYTAVAGESLGFRLARWLSTQRREGRAPRPVWTVLHRVVMLGLFTWAVLRYDAFVLRGGDSFFALRDLGLLRRLGKRVVVVFFGSDSRPSYMNGASIAGGISGNQAAVVTGAKRRAIEATERHASEIVCHVMSAQLHRRHAVAFLEMGIPRRLKGQVVPEPEIGPGRPVRVLHAPSRPEGKGTQAIHDAVAGVRERGIDVELVVVTGRPNREVLDAIRSCHFVVDQLQSDTPMAAFAAEAAALGRPAVVGGYGWEELRRHTRAEAMPPSHLCHPSELIDAIETLATDHAYRRELGGRARRFIEDGWSPEAVAQNFMLLLAAEAPDYWFFDPADVVYAHGVGVEEDRLKVVLREVMDSDGPGGFHVSDKPRLERSLVDLAGE